MQIVDTLLQGKKGVWIKLPIEHVNLVEAAVKVDYLLSTKLSATKVDILCV